MEWLECQSPVSIEMEFLKLMPKWEKCVNVHGEYVKK
jgi:hypothetical protein